MRWYAAIAGTVLLTVGAGLALASPLLPMAQGYERIAPRIWVDRAATPAQRQTVIARVTEAEAAAGTDLGSWQAAPRWQVCTSAACDTGGPRGRTYLDRLIRLRPSVVDDPRFYLHEAIHAELHNAAGFTGWLGGKRLPVWLDEGVAVLSSGTDGAPEAAPDCATPAARPPRTPEDFALLAGPKGQTATAAYRLCACATQDWQAAGNSIDGLTARLRAGETF